MHATAMAVVLLVATAVGAATADANDDVQDVRLRVQNLTRPDGKQSAILTGVALPGSEARPVTATLEVGSTTVVLTGKISRSGRLRAVGRRLALATPLESFTSIDMQLHGFLDAAAESGQGRFAIGSAPWVPVQGSWTATRQAKSSRSR